MNFPSITEVAELHVISDLHLGGAPGFQIFGSTKELTWFIDTLQRRPPATRIALVINGDFVDFLAQGPALPFDPEGAFDKLVAIASDPNFQPIFQALQRFTATAGRQLFINLGNHDLELALPWVKEKLLDLLSGADPTARGRIILSFGGSGVRVTVGGAQVLCVHGNEVDAWNVTDYEQLRRIGRAFTQGKVPDPWVPNAGSQLVAEVMNPLKQRFPFIDLLKPEKDAVFPTLIALDPAVAKQVPKFSLAAGRRGWDAVRMATGFLSEEETGVAAGVGAARVPIRATVLQRDLRDQRQKAAESLLDQAEYRWRDETMPLDLVTEDQRGEYVGVFGATWQLVRGKGTVEALREALDKLDKDKSFEFGAEDETYRDLDKQVGASIDFLLAGHTHLERRIRRKRGRGWYFNSGTWAGLIKIPAELRQDIDAFAQLFGRLQSSTMAALDASATAPGVTERRCSVVSIWREVAETVGELRRVTLDSGAYSLQPLAGTRCSVS